MDIARSDLERWFNAHHAGSRHDFGATAVPAPRERLAALWRPEFLDLAYPPTDGSPAVRSLLADLEGLAPADLVLTCGATEANAAALMAAARPGSMAVLQHPLYYQFEPFLAAQGVGIRRWDPASAAEPPVASDTCLVVVNSPHNPTGRVVDVEPLARLAEALPECRVLVDEVYRDVTGGGGRSAAALSPRVAATGSFAKRWGMPGLRLGWVACQDAAFRDRAHAWHHYLAHSPPRASERLVAGMWPELEIVRQENQALANRNVALLGAWLGQQADRLAGAAPAAGVTTLVWPRFGGYDGDDAALALTLRDEHEIFVLPGSYVGYPGALRLGCGHREAADLLAALARLETAMRAIAAVATGSRAP